MRLPPFLTVAALGLVLLGPTALACHGAVYDLGSQAACVGSVCGRFYFVSSGGVGSTAVLALYQESNGIPGLQRGNTPLLQGGYDDCFVPGAKDARIF